MFCEKCGARILENEKFCRNCGTPVLCKMNQNGSGRAISEPVVSVNTASEKNSRKGLMIGLCAIVLVIGTAGVLTAFHFLSNSTVVSEMTADEISNDSKNEILEENKSKDENEKTDVAQSTESKTNDSAYVSGGDAFEEAIHQTSFWGVWCKASEQYEAVESVADELISKGYYAQVVLTSDWSELNQDTWYAVTSGMYGTEEEAVAALSQIQNIYGDAYVKYSGEYQGFQMDYGEEQAGEGYPSCQVVHCNEFITLREVPNTSGKEICKIPLGTEVSFMENSENGFAKVEYNGCQGYCLVSYLDFLDDSNGIFMTVYNCKKSITLRKIPSTKGEEICQIPLGATVVFRSSAANGFYLISYGGYTGYSLVQYLTE